MRYDAIPGVWLRYDGYETRLQVDRAKEFRGLELDELEALIEVLTKAARCRKDGRKACGRPAVVADRHAPDEHALCAEHYSRLSRSEDIDLWPTTPEGQAALTCTEKFSAAKEGT